MSETLELLNSETMNDSQATWIADGVEMVVAVLGVLEEAHPKHQSCGKGVPVKNVPIRAISEKLTSTRNRLTHR
jgi:hypothetical protein